MSASLVESIDLSAALRSIESGVAALRVADWSALADDDLLDAFRQFEVVRRQLAAVDHALIVEAEDRELAETLSYRNTAQARGTISPQHASLITATLAKRPDAVRREQGEATERSLVDYAEQFDPDNLARIIRRLLYCYDQDGAEPDTDERRQRNRYVRLVQRPDGSGYGEFDLTAELTELLLTHFNALAGPAPAADGTPDPRTAGQRRHDALLESPKLVVRARLLPRVNGVTATVIVTMTKKQYERGCGLARTAHGALVPAQQALSWGGYGGDLRLLAVALGDMKPVEAYSTTARLHDETQRLVLHAVHGGCTFPECPVLPGHTQAHHLIDFADGGATSVNLGAPVCSMEHHRRVAQGWRAEILGKRVGWIPPPSVDPEQKPRFNDLHLPQLLHPTDDEDENLPEVADGEGRGEQQR